MDEKLKEIGKKVKLARLSQDYTQKQLSAQSKVSNATIVAIESGDYNYQIKSLLLLCEFLKLKIEVTWNY